MTLSLTTEWCRACGRGSGPGTTCPHCSTPLDRPGPARSRVGLVFEQRRRLRSTRRALCIADSGAELVLHWSPKETGPVPAEGAEPVELIPSRLSPAGRLLFATRDLDREVSREWDLGVVQPLIGPASEGTAALRALADDALELGWTDVFDWIGLPVTEKAWLRAHAAASAGRSDQLLEHLTALPADAYAAKVALLRPFVPVLAEAPDTWLPLLSSWAAAGVPDAAELRSLVAGDWAEGARAGAALLTSGGLEDWGRAWAGAVEAVAAARPTPPPGPGWPAWSAAALYVQGRAGTPLDGVVTELAELPRGLLDDLVDARALTPEVDPAGVPYETAAHVLARVRPEALDDTALAAVQHTAEQARRRFLAGDERGLAQLPDDADVRHYRALEQVRRGGEPDAGRLRPETVTALSGAVEGRSAVQSGAADLPPRAVLDDPTLWPLFGDLAREGRIQAGPVQRAQYPEFARWCDLQRMLGLVWEGRFADAERLGRSLVDDLADERVADEALNLTAFALHQQGRDTEALRYLERAISGSYTEALLVNTGIVASLVDPATAARYLGLLVRDAPTGELRRAAMLRAVGVWDDQPSGTPFPPDLVGPLQDVLTEACPLPEYQRLLRAARAAAPEVVLALPEPAGEQAGLLALHRARVRFSKDPDYLQDDLAGDFIAVHRRFGRPEWFDSEWGALVEGFRAATFVEFGEGYGSAVFWDTVHTTAPELLTTFERLLLVPQAGAHMSVAFNERKKSWLTDEALVKFFFRPVEDLLGGRTGLDAEQVEPLVDNLAKCLVVAGFSYLEATRETRADEYNEATERARWDTQNRPALRRLREQALDGSAVALEQLDRVLDRLRRLPVTDERRRSARAALTEQVEDWRREVIDLRSRL